MANDLDCDDVNPLRVCAPWSCLDVLNNGDSVGDGLYWVDLGGTGITQAWCDMTTDGGGWTLVVWIDPSSRAHADNPAAVGDPAVRSGAAKYSDAVINALTTTSYWYYACSTGKRSFVRTASGNWTSMYTNSEDWSMDDDRDGSFECAANRAGYVFADYPACIAHHSDFGSHDGTGCAIYEEGWNRDGSLWAR